MLFQLADTEEVCNAFVSAAYDPDKGRYGIGAVIQQGTRHFYQAAGDLHEGPITVSLPDIRIDTVQKVAKHIQGPHNLSRTKREQKLRLSPGKDPRSLAHQLTTAQVMAATMALDHIGTGQAVDIYFKLPKNMNPYWNTDLQKLIGDINATQPEQLIEQNNHKDPNRRQAVANLQIAIHRHDGVHVPLDPKQKGRVIDEYRGFLMEAYGLAMEASQSPKGKYKDAKTRTRMEPHDRAERRSFTALQA